MSKQSDTLQIASARTTGDSQHLGKWVAQIKGLPQARAYGGTKIEAVGMLVLTFGKEQGIAKAVGKMIQASGKKHGISFSSNPDPQRLERL